VWVILAITGQTSGICKDITVGLVRNHQSCSTAFRNNTLARI
jgi:hypothetical protein